MVSLNEIVRSWDCESIGQNQIIKVTVQDIVNLTDPTVHIMLAEICFRITLSYRYHTGVIPAKSYTLIN